MSKYIQSYLKMWRTNLPEDIQDQFKKYRTRISRSRILLPIFIALLALVNVFSVLVSSNLQISEIGAAEILVTLQALLVSVKLVVFLHITHNFSIDLKTWKRLLLENDPTITFHKRRKFSSESQSVIHEIGKYFLQHQYPHPLKRKYADAVSSGEFKNRKSAWAFKLLKFDLTPEEFKKFNKAIRNLGTSKYMIVGTAGSICTMLLVVILSEFTIIQIILMVLSFVSFFVLVFGVFRGMKEASRLLKQSWMKYVNLSPDQEKEITDSQLFTHIIDNIAKSNNQLIVTA